MRFTSNKVIVAKVFNQSPWETAEGINSHGTHVSGTIAGRRHRRDHLPARRRGRLGGRRHPHPLSYVIDYNH